LPPHDAKLMPEKFQLKLLSPGPQAQGGQIEK
jgi:hypothetical protein